MRPNKYGFAKPFITRFSKIIVIGVLGDLTFWVLQDLNILGFVGHP